MDRCGGGQGFGGLRNGNVEKTRTSRLRGDETSKKEGVKSIRSHM